MPRKIKFLLSSLISRLAWEVFYKKRNPGRKIPVLCYHRVLPDLFEDENDPLYTVLPEQFESHMDYLVKTGFQSISLQEFGEIALGLKPLRKRVVLITFDDGYADNYAIAWPICRKYKIKLNLFLPTGAIGVPQSMVMTKNGYRFYNVVNHSGSESFYFYDHLRKFPHLWRPLTWREISEMSNAGVSFGLHGHTHRNLAFLTPGELIEDIVTGLAIFQKKMGARP